MRQRKNGLLDPKGNHAKHLDFWLSQFGTRGSEVRILSPRPIESITYNLLYSEPTFIVSRFVSLRLFGLWMTLRVAIASVPPSPKSLIEPVRDFPAEPVKQRNWCRPEWARTSCGCTGWVFRRADVDQRRGQREHPFAARTVLRTHRPFNRMKTALLISLERDPLPADRLRRLRAFPGGWSDYGSDLLLWRWVTSFASTNPLVYAEVVSNVEGDDFEW